MSSKFQHIIDKVQELYGSKPNPLHIPTFISNERENLVECIDSTFVSSVGKFVDDFEKNMAEYTGSKYAVAVMNGTAALQLAMVVAGVEKNTEVITQSLSFVATANAILYIGASPIFIDVDKDKWSLSPDAISKFLNENTEKKGDATYNKTTGKRIAAIVPMHTFGAMGRIEEIQAICEEWNIPLVEDAAESLGSTKNGKHAGTYGTVSAVSFNGNKIMTTGGGGIILTDNHEIAKKAKHLSTTAKDAHAWEYHHSEMGYNFRMPNINAALGCAQLEKLPKVLQNKRKTGNEYTAFFQENNIPHLEFNTTDNYWLNTILLENKTERNEFLQFAHDNKIFARPIWNLLNELPYLNHYQTDDLTNSRFLSDRAVNLPSSYRNV